VDGSPAEEWIPEGAVADICYGNGVAER
jgi:hypothetical protein